jgi:hypothetical protein
MTENNVECGLLLPLDPREPSHPAGNAVSSTTIAVRACNRLIGTVRDSRGVIANLTQNRSICALEVTVVPSPNPQVAVPTKTHGPLWPTPARGDDFQRAGAAINNDGG